jgi:enterochelin esterase-like enzyme
MVSPRRRGGHAIADDAPDGPTRAGLSTLTPMSETAAGALPRWLGLDPVRARLEPMTVEGTAVGPVDAQVWTPARYRASDRLPLLVCHDGPELAAQAGITRYVGALVRAGELPPMRVALLAPGVRNAWYSADLDYAAALTHRVLPGLQAAYRCADRVVLAGISLGALAALHAEWAHPGTFAGLYLSSGSFFTLDTDPQERGFEGFAAVTAFVGRVLRAPAAPSRPVVSVTCGAAEENAVNNRVLAARLAELGLDTSHAEVPGGHTFATWRDMLDPHLTTLLRRAWRLR